MYWRFHFEVFLLSFVVTLVRRLHKQSFGAGLTEKVHIINVCIFEDPTSFLSFPSSSSYQASKEKKPVLSDYSSHLLLWLVLIRCSIVVMPIEGHKKPTTFLKAKLTKTKKNLLFRKLSYMCVSRSISATYILCWN
jgi:hypothetical protein